MGIDKLQLKDLISRTLKKVPGFYSEDAVELMMMTAAAESERGHYLAQIKGPAKGVMQVEPNTMRDNYGRFLYFRDHLKMQIFAACGVNKPDIDALEYNMAFNILMARLKYWRIPKPIPSDLEGKARYHAEFYNADGEWEDTLSDYRRLVLNH